MDYTGLINVQARAELGALKLTSQQMNDMATAMDAALKKIVATPPMANAAAKALRAMGVAAADAAKVSAAIRGAPATGGAAAPPSNVAALQAQMAGLRASMANAVAMARNIPAALAGAGPTIAGLRTQASQMFTGAIASVGALRTSIANGLAGAAMGAGAAIKNAMLLPLNLAKQAAGGVVGAVRGIGAALIANLQPARLQANAIALSAKAAAGVVTAVKGIGAALSSIVTALAVVGTLFTVNAIQKAREWEAELAKINTIARMTGPELQAIGDGIRQMAAQSGEPMTQLSDSYYDLLSANLQVADANEVLRQSLILAVGGIGDTKGAVDLMTSAWNAFHLTQKTSEEAMNVFAASVERGKLRINDIGETFSTVAPLAFSMGIGINQIGAAYATLTGKGFTAGEAMTAMRSAMIGLQRQNKSLQEATQRTGIDFLALAKEKGLQVAMVELRKYSEEAGIPLIKLLGRIEGVQYALSVTGENAEGYVDMLGYMNKAASEGTVAQGLYERRMQSFDRVVKQLQQSFNDLAIEWGTALLPPLTKIASFVGGVVQGMADWMKQNRELVTSIAPVISALTVLAGLRIGLSALLMTIPNLTGAFTALGIGTGTAFASIAAFIGPILVVAAALGGLYYAIENNIAGLGGLKDVTKPVADAIGTVVTAIKSLISGGNVDWGKTFAKAADQMGVAFGKLGDHVRKALPIIWAAVLDLGRKVVDGIIDWVPKIADAGKRLFAGIGEWIAVNAPKIGAALGELTGQLIGWVREQIPKLANAARGWIEGFIAWIPEGITALGNALTGLIQGVVNWITSGDNLQKIVAALVEWSVAFITWIPDVLTKLAAKLPEILGAILGFLAKAIPAVVDGALKLGGSILGGIADGITKDPGSIVKAIGLLLAGGAVIQAVIAAAAIAAKAWSVAFAAAQTVGTAISTAIQSGLGAVGTKLSPLFGKLGLGGGLGAAFAVGFAAVAWVKVFETYNEIKAGLDKQTADIGTNVGKQIISGTTEQLQKSQGAIKQGLIELNGVWDAGIFTTDTRKSLEEQLAAIDAELARRAAMPPKVLPSPVYGPPAPTPQQGRVSSGTWGPDMSAGKSVVANSMNDIAGALRAGAPVIKGAADQAFITIPDSISGMSKEAVAAANQAPADIAKALEGGYSDIDTAMKALTSAMKDPMTTTVRIMKLRGQLASKKLAEGLQSSDPLVRAEAERLRASIEEQLATLESTAKIYGLHSGQNWTDAMTGGLIQKLSNTKTQAEKVALLTGELTGNALKKGLHSKDKLVKEAARKYKQWIEDELKKAKDLAGTYGDKTGDAYVAGINSQSNRTAAHGAGYGLARAAGRGLRAESPPKEGPLKDIGKWAIRTGEWYAQSLASTAPAVQRAAVTMVSGVPGVLNATPSLNRSVNYGGRGGMQTGQPDPERMRLTELHRELAVQSQILGEIASSSREGAAAKAPASPITVTVDARGAENPKLVGQAVGDAMATVLRDQTSRSVLRG